MRGLGALGYALLSGLVVILVVLGIFVFQLDTLEERFIRQSKQLRALGEATERLGGRIERLSAQIESQGLSVGTGARRSRNDEYADVRVLHPEVPNFLEEHDFQIFGEGAQSGGPLLRGWPSGDLKGFNPITENAADLSDVSNYVAAGIARRMIWTDPERFYGDLAWRVEITNDFKEFTIYLRRGVRWHEVSGVDLDDPKFAWLGGEHLVTANDLAFSMDMLMNPQVQNGFAKGYYEELESWEALDDHTFVIRWKKKQWDNIGLSLGIDVIPEFVFAFEEDGTRIPDETMGLRLNQHWYNNRGYVGSGPYRLASYESGVQMRLERNENYHGEKPAIDEIVFPIYTDANRTLLLLKAHEVHVGWLRPSQYREEVLKWQDRPRSEWPQNSAFLNGDIQCEKLLRFAYSYIGWNGDKPLFADARVRTAMTLALNRRDIIDNIYVGFGKLATGPYLAATGYNDPDVDLLDFDLPRAAALLAEAGWEDTNADGLLDFDLNGEGVRVPFEFTLLIHASSPEYASLANVFKEDLLEIGVKLNIEAVEWSLMQKRMEEKRFDAYTGGWGLSFSSVDQYQLWHSTQADVPKGSNRVGFRNPEVDDLIVKLRETFDPEQRQAMSRRVARLIYDSQSYSFFRWPEASFCWWKDVHDVRFAKSRPQTSSLPWWVESQP
jgi:peptide/nickel transport system substrate-binding protein